MAKRGFHRAKRTAGWPKQASREMARPTPSRGDVVSNLRVRLSPNGPPSPRLASGATLTKTRWFVLSDALALG